MNERVAKWSRLALSWALWSLGHLLSVPIVRWDWAWLHTPYSRLMQASLRIQYQPRAGRHGA